jgi:hypothetical protein
MAQESGGGEERGGLLIEGAEGYLWFIRPDGDEPVRLDENDTRRIKEALKDFEVKQFSEVLPQGAQKILADLFGDDLPSFGAFFWRGSRLPR